MTCFSPLQGWSIIGGGITFNYNESHTKVQKQVPCGQCIGCRLDRSGQWAIRCHHEASLHETNSFITLTFNDENLPADRSLSVRTFQLFMKRLRKKYTYPIRFYACGEYGENLGRPHYHACLFGHDFKDKKIWMQARGKDPLYRSAELEELWPYGFSTIGEVTLESAAYVARYIVKKITGDQAEKHYQFTDENGVIHKQKPEFTVMSRKPGVGAKWLARFATDIYPDDFVIIKGKKKRPPRYYDLNYELVDPESFRKLKTLRKTGLREHLDNNTPERLRVREIIQKKKAELLKRSHDRRE